MRKILFLSFLIFVIVSMCFPLHVHAKNLTYASDYYVYGNDLVNKGQYEEGLQAYQTARSMDERFYNEHYGITYQIGWVLNKLGRYDEALKEFQIAEKYRPEWVAPFAIYYNEGCVLARLGRSEEALKAFDSALLYQNTNWYVLFNKGIVLARMGRYAEAVTAFETSRKAYGSYSALLGSYQETAATYYKSQGIPQPAEIPTTVVTDTGSTLTIAPDTYDQETSIDTLMRAGKDYTARYQYANALVVFDRVLKIDPGNYQAMDWKGNALANLGRYDESLKIFDQAILYLDYRVNENFYIDCHYQRAWVLAKLGRYDEAIKEYDKLFIVDPDIFRGHYEKAWVLSKLGRYDDSVIEYNRSLDWENQHRLEVQSYSILGPLGTYIDVANAYDKSKSMQSFLTAVSPSPSYDVVIYQTDFSANPQWQTSRPRLYYWDQINQSYHFKSDASPGFADINVPYNETPFRLEYDITIPHADPGTLVRFGMSQYNISENSQKQMIRYNVQNVILGEFKSWRAGKYRSIKDGDKTFQLYAINMRRLATDPVYEGMCRINRELSIAIPSFGDNRVYHVVIEFDPGAETIATKVTDNLHEKTYYVCSGMVAQVGMFNSMDRLILVAEPSEGAYIEGSIDNIVLSIPAALNNNATPVADPVRLSQNYSPLENVTEQAGSPQSIITTPATHVSIILPIIAVIIFIVTVYLNKGNQK